MAIHKKHGFIVIGGIFAAIGAMWMYSRTDLPPPTPPRPELAVQSLELELPTARVDALELVMVPVEFPEPGVQPLQLPPALQRATVPNMQLLAARPHVELAVNRQIEPVDQAGPPPAPMALPVPHFYRPRFLAGVGYDDGVTALLGATVFSFGPIHLGAGLEYRFDDERVAPAAVVSAQMLGRLHISAVISSDQTPIDESVQLDFAGSHLQPRFGVAIGLSL